MTIREIYNLAIRMGIDADLRGRESVERSLQEKKEKFNKLGEQEREVFNKETLENPYSDSNILHIADDREIKRIMVGIDIEPAELLIAKELGNIDLIIAHHPLGKSLANLHSTMDMQCDILNLYGVPINVAEGLMREKISEVARGVNRINHQRTIDAARLLGFNLINVHTPCDNLVAKFLKDKIDQAKPERIGDLIRLLEEIPEYKEAMKIGAGPKIFVGSEENRCGKIALTELTGGTEGSPKLYEKMAQARIGTVVGMHVSEEHKKEAEAANINIVIAGHISSDSLGVNLFLDELEKRGVEIISCSGLIRVSRKTKKICFIGGPSTGKTTLAKYLAEELTRQNHSVELVGEFARDFIANNGKINEPIAQLAIVHGQKEKEKIAYAKNPEFVVCDAASFLSPVYFHFLKDTVFGETAECGAIENQIWQEIGGEIGSYNFVFFLPVEFIPREDGVRLFTDQVHNISDRIEKFLHSHNIGYYELRGTVEERASAALKIICTK